MGWKSTIDITREEAIRLVLERIYNCNDTELADVVERLGYGEDSDLPYFGYNFNITHDKPDYDDND